MENFRTFTRVVVLGTLALLTVSGLRAIKIGHLDYRILSEEKRTVDVAWGEKGDKTIKIDSLIIPSTVTINDKDYTVTEIRKQGFESCRQISHFIDIPSTVEIINSKAFMYIENIDSIILKPGLRIIMDDAFSGSSILNCHIPTTVDSIGDHAWTASEKLEKINWPSNITHVPLGCFDGCSSLQSFDFSNITNIGHFAFEDYKGDVTIKGGTYVGVGAFFCFSGKNLTLEPGPTEIDDEAFYLADELEKLEIPSGVTVGHRAFAGTRKLRHLTIHDGAFVYGAAFGYPIPDDDDGLYRRIDTVVYLAKIPQALSSSLFINDTYRNGHLFVLPEAYEFAKQTSPWKNFEHIEMAGSEITGTDQIPDSAEEEERIFTLSGVEVMESKARLSPGIYIRRKGAQSSKMIVR